MYQVGVIRSVRTLFSEADDPKKYIGKGLLLVLMR